MRFILWWSRCARPYGKRSVPKALLCAYMRAEMIGNLQCITCNIWLCFIVQELERLLRAFYCYFCVNLTADYSHILFLYPEMCFLHRSSAVSPVVNSTVLVCRHFGPTCFALPTVIKALLVAARLSYLSIIAAPFPICS